MESVHEEWRPIPGFEGKYEASNLGAVRSLDRLVTRECRWGMKSFRWKGRVLKPVQHHTGYLVTKLGACKTLFRFHQLVAWAWHGKQPDASVINHINGNKHDNRPENIEYITSSENVKHAYRTGLLDNRGEKNGRHRIRRTASTK